MPCDAPRDTTFRGGDVDVGIADEVGGVGDLGAVRRKKWTGRDVPIGGESLGVATLPADGPDIASVEEGDPILRERRVAQQEWMIGWGLGGYEDRGENGKAKRQARKPGVDADHRASKKTNGIG